MKSLLTCGILLMTFVVPTAGAADGDALLTDFTSDSADFGWYVLNDDVMGGRSEGTFERDAVPLHFIGNTNTNGGGFSSIRTASMQLDLSQYVGVRLRVKGDGRRYTWRLATTARWHGRPVGYWADFATLDGTWTTVDIPFSRFVPKFRGNRLDGPPLDTARITGMGLMIYDGKDGPFELYLDSVHAYSERAPFSLAEYQWRRRVLVLSAADQGEANLAIQREAVDATREEFADRDMLLVTLLDDAVSRAGDRELTHADVVATRKALGMRPGGFALRLIGKDGSVKMSRDTVTPMAEIYGLIDGMPMRRREQRMDR